MLHIHYGPVTSWVECADAKVQKSVYKLLDQELSPKVDGYFFTEEYQSGTWDGRKHFFSPKTGKFQSGLLARVLKVLGDDFPVEVEGYPQPNEAYDNLDKVSLYGKDGDITLYDYQLTTVKRVLRYSRGVLRIATNGGKTEVMAGLLKVLGTPQSLLIAPTREIFRQTVSRLQERLRHSVGAVGDSTWDPCMTGVTVAMYQTLSRRLSESQVKKWVKSTPVILGDEIHKLRDSRYQKVFQSCNASIRVGVSGTPFGKDPVDRMTVLGATGSILATVGNAELIEKGVSSKPNVVFVEPSVPRVEAIQLERASWDYALQNKYRNQMMAELAQGFVATGHQTVVMVTQIEHGRAIQRYYPAAELVHAQSGNRDLVKSRLAAGEVFCCICTSIFDTGLSVDYIEALVMAAGGKSEYSVPQRVGRSLRKPGSKEKDLWIVESWDSFNKYTRSHANTRRKWYETQGFNLVADLPADVSEYLSTGGTKKIGKFPGSK